MDGLRGKILVLPEVYKEVHTGGPFAVVKKMYDLDKENFDYIYINKIIERQENNKNLLSKFKNLLLKNPYFKIFHIFGFKYFKYKIKFSHYKIDNYNTIISHDPLLSYIILKEYKNLKVINIYHGQGSYYNELTDLVGIGQSKLLKKILDNFEKYIFSKSFKIGFPSIGAKDALIKTNSSLKSIFDIRKKDIGIYYNGINQKKIIIEHNTELEKGLKKDSYNFVTISSLNKAKGVDRIPKFLGNLKKKGIKFTWTLVGKGELSEYIKKEIIKNNIQSEITFHEKGFKKSEIFGLFSKSDFYILFHRFSIFDIATLESMSFGNIPILTNIGGNKEVILEKNGVLIDDCDEDNSELFLKFIQTNNISILKKLNIDIVENHFSDYNFINKYKKTIYKK